MAEMWVKVKRGTTYDVQLTPMKRQRSDADALYNTRGNYERGDVEDRENIKEALNEIKKTMPVTTLLAFRFCACSEPTIFPCKLS